MIIFGMWDFKKLSCTFWWRWRSSGATRTLSCRRATATGSARPSARDSSTRRLTGSRPTCQSRAGPQTESKMCLKSPGTDVGAAGFERCPRTFETHFTYGRGECLNLWKHTIVTVSNIVNRFMQSYYPWKFYFIRGSSCAQGVHLRYLITDKWKVPLEKKQKH